MTHVSDSAYIAVLENKLVQAERSLYEFRQIFVHWTKERDGRSFGNTDRQTRTERTDNGGPGTLLKKNGLYPGQLPYQTDDEEEECLD